MNIDEALAVLGVCSTTLADEETMRLDRDGFLPLPSILSASQIDAFRARLDDLVALEGEQAGKEVHQEAGTDRLADSSTRTRCSTYASPTRACWPRSPESSGASSSSRH